MLQLTDRQLSLWRMRQRGLSISEIASRLGVSRQAIHKNLQAVENKIYRALISAAAASKVEIRKIDARKGILIGWSPWLKTEVYITFSSRNGLQIWFKHEGDCKTCPLRDDCIRILVNEAEERGVRLPIDAGLDPSKLAEIFFNKLLGEG